MHCYADDTQYYTADDPDVLRAPDYLKHCNNLWVGKSVFQLTQDNTEIIVTGTDEWKEMAPTIYY